MNHTQKIHVNKTTTDQKFSAGLVLIAPFRGMDFCVPIGVILVELDSSSDDSRIEAKNIWGEKGIETCDIVKDGRKTSQFRSSDLTEKLR